MSCSVGSSREDDREDEWKEDGGGGHGLSHVGIQAEEGERKGETRECRKDVRVTGGAGESRIEVSRRGRSRFDDT